MGRYNFASQFGGATDAITQLMMERKMEARQAMLDQIMQTREAQGIEESKARMANSAESTRSLVMNREGVERQRRQQDVGEALAVHGPTEPLSDELTAQAETEGMGHFLKPRTSTMTPLVGPSQEAPPPEAPEGQQVMLGMSPMADPATRRMTPPEQEVERKAGVYKGISENLEGVTERQPAIRAYLAGGGDPKEADSFGNAYAGPRIPKPQSVQEFEYARDEQGYTGSYEDREKEQANLKNPVVNVTNTPNDQGYTPRQQTNFNRLSTAYDTAPLIKAADRTIVLKDAVAAIRKDPSLPASQLTLAYSYIQALDTYQSAVREGELTNLGVLGTRMEQLRTAANRVASSGAFMPPEVATQIADASETLVSTIERGSAQAKTKFKSRAKVLGIEKMWGEFEESSAPMTEPSSTDAPASEAAGIEQFLRPQRSGTPARTPGVVKQSGPSKWLVD